MKLRSDMFFKLDMVLDMGCRSYMGLESDIGFGL